MYTTCLCNSSLLYPLRSSVYYLTVPLILVKPIRSSVYHLSVQLILVKKPSGEVFIIWLWHSSLLNPHRSSVYHLSVQLILGKSHRSSVYYLTVSLILVKPPPVKCIPPVCATHHCWTPSGEVYTSCLCNSSLLNPLKSSVYQLSVQLVLVKSLRSSVYHLSVQRIIAEPPPVKCIPAVCTTPC